MLNYPKSDQLEIIRYSNSDFLDAKIAKDPHRAIFLCWSESAISQKIVKRIVIALLQWKLRSGPVMKHPSSNIQLRNFDTVMHVMDNSKRPLKIYYDNKSIALYSNNNRNSSNPKHVEIKFIVIQERVQSRQVSIEHIGNNSIIEDSLTKGLEPKVFHQHPTHVSVLLFDDVLVLQEFMFWVLFCLGKCLYVINVTFCKIKKFFFPQIVNIFFLFVG